MKFCFTKLRKVIQMTGNYVYDVFMFLKKDTWKKKQYVHILNIQFLEVLPANHFCNCQFQVKPKVINESFDTISTISEKIDIHLFNNFYKNNLFPFFSYIYKTHLIPFRFTQRFSGIYNIYRVEQGTLYIQHYIIRWIRMIILYWLRINIMYKI